MIKLISVLTVILLSNLTLGQNEVFICTSSDDIYLADISNCNVQHIGNTNIEFQDIAYNTVTSELIGINTYGEVFLINQLNAVPTYLFATTEFNSLHFDQNGTLLGINDNQDIYSINTTNGGTTFIKNANTEYQPSGDLITYDGDVFYTGVKFDPPNNPTGALIRVDITGNTPSQILPGLTFAFGLAALGCEPDIYSFTTKSALLHENPDFDQYTYHCDLNVSGIIYGAAQKSEPPTFDDFSLGNDTTYLCDQFPGILDATVTNGTYQWNDGSTGPTLSVSQAGYYSVSVHSGMCNYSDTVYADFGTNPIFNDQPDTALCPDENLTVHYSNSNYDYMWSDGTTENHNYFDSPGYYWVDIDNSGCIIRDYINIDYTIFNVSKLPNDTILCLDESLLVDITTPNATYAWNNGVTTPNYELNEEGLYHVDVTLNNCQWSDEIIIKKIDCEIATIMPNVFTPNGDGINDLFIPIYLNAINSPRLTIFNRWGELVLQTNDPDIGWNGTFKNEPCSEGVYFWKLEFTDNFGNESSSHGHFELSR